MKGYVTSEAARMVIEAFLREGFTLRDISRKSGINTKTLQKIKDGKAVTIQKGTHRSLMELPIIMTEADKRQPGHVGTTRRLRALRRIGYRKSFLVSFTGLHGDTLAGVSRGDSDPNLLTQDTVRGAYDQLLKNPRPSQMNWQSRDYAEKQGWHPPEAWANVDIDDPTASPS